MRGTIGITSLVALLAAACAQGSTADLYVLSNGIYELATVSFEGDCALEDAITPGGEHVGKIARVSANVSDTSVSFDPCDDFFDDVCMPAGFSDPISMIRDEDDLYASDASWEVTGCNCFEDYRGSREVSGLIVENDKAELTWTFTLPAAPQDCSCTAAACSATVAQRLSFIGPDETL